MSQQPKTNSFEEVAAAVRTAQREWIIATVIEALRESDELRKALLNALRGFEQSGDFPSQRNLDLRGGWMK